MYIAGMYFVAWETKNGGYTISKDFETEQEARNFGNVIWKKPDTKAVYIKRTGFYKKRRRSTTIAQAVK